jgi:hypothetical protein
MSLIVDGSKGLSFGSPIGIPGGRLTLASGTPVMTATQAAKTTLFYTPYLGALIPIFDGSLFQMQMFSELSALLSDTTKNPAAIGASQIVDWFVWNDNGVLRLSHGPSWPDDTGGRFGPSGIQRINGIWLNAASISNGPAAARGTLVGTTRSNASSQLDWIFGTAVAGGGAGWFGVWNAYNRVDVATTVIDTTASFSRGPGNGMFNNSSGNRVSAVMGLQEDAVSVMCNANANGINGWVAVYISLNLSDGSASIGNLSGVYTAPNASYIPVVGHARHIPPLGFNYWQMSINSGGGGDIVTGGAFNAGGIAWSGRM